MLLPGIVVAHITDRPDALAAKISADYFAVAFQQAVRLLGTGGKLLAHFGVTTKIASALKISLATDLSAEVGKFSRRSSDGFINVTETNAGFSRESLRHLALHVRAAELNPTATIGRLMHGTETGLKMKRISGFGHGHGLVGVLTLAPDRIPAGHEAGSRRPPRAFPHNKISEYDECIAIAQKTIAGRIEPRDRIRVAERCNRTDRFLCCTDTSVFLLSPGLRRIKAECRIADLQRCGVKEHSILHLEFSKPPPVMVSFANAESAHDALWYLTSQKRMLHFFHASILR
jgi:hypothetical protein